jgi:hypothetical protein
VPIDQGRSRISACIGGRARKEQALQLGVQAVGHLLVFASTERATGMFSWKETTRGARASGTPGIGALRFNSRSTTGRCVITGGAAAIDFRIAKCPLLPWHRRWWVGTCPNAVAVAVDPALALPEAKWTHNAAA